MKKKTNKRS